MGEEYSHHFTEARQERIDLIENEIGLGNIIDEFVVDRGHIDGKEIHCVTDTAIIIVKNAETNKIITELVARPGQIKRLYESVGRIAPRFILRKAYIHNVKKYNRV